MLVVALLTACSAVNAVREETYGPLNASTPCCRSFDELTYTPLPIGDIEFDIGPTGPTFEFDTGKSFFKAFALPERTGPLKIRITSFSNIKVGGYFQPDVLLLDGDKKVSRRIPAPLLQQPARRIGFFQMTKTGEFEIPAGEKYSFLIIRTTDELLATSERTLDRSTIAPGVTFETPGRILNWPAGRLRVETSL